jgi:hypothetical protein
VVEGLKSDEPFETVDSARVFAEENLTKNVLNLACQSGTSETRIVFDVSDVIVKSHYENERIFLSRAVSADLIGLPDLVVN